MILCIESDKHNKTQEPIVYPSGKISLSLTVGLLNKKNKEYSIYMKNNIFASVGIIGSIASIIGLLYLYLPKEIEKPIIQKQLGNNNIQVGEQVVINNYTNQYHNKENNDSEQVKIFLSILDLITLGTNKEYIESILGLGRKKSDSKITYVYSKNDFVIKIQYDNNHTATYIKLIPKTLKFSSQLDIGKFVYRKTPLFFNKATIVDFARDYMGEGEDLRANSGASGNCANHAWFSYEYSTHRFAIPYPITVGYQASDCMDDLDLGKSNHITTDKDDSLVHNSVTPHYFELPNGSTKVVFPVNDSKMLLKVLRDVNINYIEIGEYIL